MTFTYLEYWLVFSFDRNELKLIDEVTRFT